MRIVVSFLEENNISAKKIGTKEDLYNRVMAAGRHIHDHPEDEIGVEKLAKISALSAYHFSRTFKQVFGDSPYRFLIRIRVEKSAWLLEHTHSSLQEIAIASGFSDAASFCKSFRKWKNMSPGAYRHFVSFQDQRCKQACVR